MPERTCVGCRAVVEQATLVRLALVGDRVVVDRRAPGRGAYVHPRTSCVEAANKGGLARAFRRKVSPIDDISEITGQMVGGAGSAKAVETPPGT